MAEQNTPETLAFIRKLQIWAPVSMVVLGALIYWLWKDELSTVVAGVVAFMAIPDYFAFKILGDQMEAKLNEH